MYKFFFLVILINKSFSQTVYYDNTTNLYGIINRYGNNILKPSFEVMTMFNHGFSCFKVNDKWGIINEKGQIILKPEFDDIFSFDYCLCEGLIPAKKDGKYGYYNEYGQKIIEHKFEYAMHFSNGIACIKTTNGKYNFINTRGEILFEKISFDWYEILNGEYFGELEYGNAYQLESGFYKINLNGTFNYAENQDNEAYGRYLDDICIKEKNNNSKYSTFVTPQLTRGYKDNQGNIVDIQKYNLCWVYEFEDGVALVEICFRETNQRYLQIINEKFEVLKKFDEKYELVGGSFENGLAELSYKISSPNDEIDNWDFILINKNGEIIKTMNEGVFPIPIGG